jgi:hypothetical protein
MAGVRARGKELTISELNQALRMATTLREFETNGMNEDDSAEYRRTGPKPPAFEETPSSILTYLEGWGITFDWITRRWSRATYPMVREAVREDGT